MLVDALLILAALSAVFTGFRRGFLHSLFSTIGYIGGGILGLGLGLNFTSRVHSSLSKILMVFIAVFILAEIGRRLFGGIARLFRARLLWAPLRFLDSIAGVGLELVRVTIFAYLIISIALWSPWSFAKNSIAESKIYPEMKKEMPHALDRLRADIQKKLGTIQQLKSFSNLQK
jgi:uncharacterized membrane protein required for colicin V production